MYEHFKNTKSLKSLLLSYLFYFIEKYLYKKSDIFLTVSLKEQKKIKEIVPKIKTYYHPVFYYKKFNEPVTDFDNRNNLLFVGANHYPNIDAIKWFGKNIMPIVNKNNPNIKLIIAGNLPKNLKEEIKNDNIIFLGKISEEKLEALYKKSKLVVIPLRFGAGVKGKTIEAMYHGLPIVATSFALEGLPGNIENLIKPINNANDFANEILKTYNNDKYNYEISKKINEYIKKYFSYEQALSVMKKILDS
jgi:glycosyltransferase involved in cell wall biosynthesis